MIQMVHAFHVDQNAVYLQCHCFHTTPSLPMLGHHRRRKLLQSHLGQWSSYACLLMWCERARRLICCQMRL